MNTALQYVIVFVMIIIGGAIVVNNIDDYMARNKENSIAKVQKELEDMKTHNEAVEMKIDRLMQRAGIGSAGPIGSLPEGK